MSTSKNTLIGSITGGLSGVASGAIIGSAILPFGGTLVGGVVGGIVGGISLGTIGGIIGFNVTPATRKKNCLIVVDMQNDYAKNGKRELDGVDRAIEKVNLLREKHKFDHVIVTKKVLSQNHFTFAETRGKKVGEKIEVKGNSVTLCARHCVEGTTGSQLISKLYLEKTYVM